MEAIMCARCNGTGQITYRDDPSAAGVSLSPGYMTYVEACSCLERNECPACSKRKLIHPQRHPDDLICLACGWKFDPNRCADD